MMNGKITERYAAALRNRMVPQLKNITFREGECLLTDGLTVELVSPEETASGLPELTTKIFAEYWGILPDVKLHSSSEQEYGDAYQISVRPEKIRITASCPDGFRNAFRTLRQMAEPERGGITFEHYVLQPCDIDDAPVMGFRGIHLCIFPESDFRFIEKLLRIAAYLKFNYAVIEAWGVFPFRSHPEFCWKDRTFPISEFERLKKAARECGITLIPQFNILGHAAAARRVSAKHAVLNFSPELQPLFEPDGWCFCLTNPYTREVLKDLVTELCDFYEDPPFFHIGCDEADGLASCRECASRDVETLMLEHLTFFHDLLSVRNCRCILWHDMLLKRGDERWKGCTAYGSAETENLYRKLPKDMIIADWEYGCSPEYPSARFFKEQGFETLICPWKDGQNLRDAGSCAERYGLDGCLVTTWHQPFANVLAGMLYYGSHAAWNGGKLLQGYRDVNSLMPRLIRQIDWDMDVRNYEETGSAKQQFPERTCCNVGLS